MIGLAETKVRALPAADAKGGGGSSDPRTSRAVPEVVAVALAFVVAVASAASAREEARGLSKDVLN